MHQLASTKKASSRIHDIEALRAVAILFVLINHLPALFPWGPTALQRIHPYFGFWDGVDLFFVISGFVIARELIPKLDASANSSHETAWRMIIAFWIRRAWRILPSAWLWILLTLISTVLFNKSHAFGDVRTVFTGTISAIMQVANFRMWICFNDPAGTGCAANSIYWSLSLEEQFYIVLPLAFLFLRKRVMWLLAFAVISQIFLDRHPVNFAWAIRSDALALGVLLAIVSRKPVYGLFEPKFLSHPVAAAAPAFLLVALAALPTEGDKVSFVPFSTGLIALVSVILVYIASFNRDYIARNALVRKVLSAIGARSFVIYLVHYPLYAATREIWLRLEPSNTVFGGNYTLRFLLTAAVLIVVATEITHRLIETPMRRKGRQIAQAFESGALTAAMKSPVDLKSQPGRQAS